MEKEKAHINDPRVCNKIDETLCIHHVKKPKGTKMVYWGFAVSIISIQPFKIISVFQNLLKLEWYQ